MLLVGQKFEEPLDYNLLFRWLVGLSIGRHGAGCDGVLQEPGTAARRRCRRQVLVAVLNLSARVAREGSTVGHPAHKAC